VTKRRQQQPPAAKPRSQIGNLTPGLIELDRFSTASLAHWKRVSADLDELNDLLYYGTEPQRQRHREEMLTALQSVSAPPLQFSRWSRLVSYQYSLMPLSAAGSLRDCGGRFNIGMDVDKAMRSPWPALYIGENFETAYREKFQIERGELVDGLTPEELALESTVSFTAAYVDGHMDRIFDVGDPEALEPLCKVLKKIKLPAEVHTILRRLGLPPMTVHMLRTPNRLQNEVLRKNWRVTPVQFGLPAPSQILAGLIHDAGFEAIRYPSSKSNSACLAVFPGNLDNAKSYVKLSDPAPAEVEFARLDMDTAEHLCGWELLRPADRPR